MPTVFSSDASGANDFVKATESELSGSLYTAKIFCYLQYTVFSATADFPLLIQNSRLMGMFVFLMRVF